MLNFFLYLGPALFALALLVGGIIEFDGLMSYGPMAMFICMNFIEGNFLTPSLVGMRLSLNTLLVFVTIMVGLWLWGPVGGIVSLPVLVWFLAAAGKLDLAPSVSSSEGPSSGTDEDPVALSAAPVADK